jgi:riboflavin biosynthesis pyrimidine reductase
MEPLERSAPIPDPLTPYLEVDRSQPRHECWVTGHMVAGLDGTAAIHGRVGALSTEPDQDLFRRMRQIADVVMVGAQTVRSEGYAPMRLSESARSQRRARGQSEMPPVAVVSRSLDLDWSSQVFAAAPEHARTIVITCAQADPDLLAAAEQAATVIIAGEERVEPAAALQALAGLGHRVVLCEGGPRWLGELVAAGRLDELCLSISPMMGGDQLPVSVTPPGAGIAQFALKSTMVAEDTLFLRYEAKPPDGRV